MTDIPTTAEGSLEEFPKSAPADRATAGPLDEGEAGAIKPSVDLGSLRIEPKRGMQLRLEVDKANNRVVAVTLEYLGSTLQLQPFAAPRTSGLWHSIRAQIMDQIVKQGGKAKEHEGVFGPEVIASVPVQAKGAFSTRGVRFVGIDGPRWFLRGVIGGLAVKDPEAAETIHQMIRNVVVVRGVTPMPPRDLLPLRRPDGPEENISTEEA
ncbi:MAG: DUF3710 domain-containing protein [Microbacteriaceae bacterium]